MNNQPEIRDIYIPEGVSLFPLAYGWWVIIVGLICLIFLIKFISWSIKTSKKHYALNRLKKIDTSNPIEAAVIMSDLLRRICNIKFKEAAVLYGQDWLAFLNTKTSCKISDKEANLLIFAPFIDKKSTEYTEETARKLKEFCRHWIGANL